MNITEVNEFNEFTKTIAADIDKMIKNKFGESGTGAWYEMAKQVAHQLKGDPDDTVEILSKILSDQNLKTPNESHYFASVSNPSQLFEDFMTYLWYSKMPCFDVEGITSEENGEKGILKSCQWKGKNLPCSALFDKVATDSGICCAFNMIEADELFVKSEYTRIVKHLQTEEKAFAFKSVFETKWYVDGHEPQSIQGVHMGLSVVLDAHTDIVNDYTYDSDYLGFKAMVLPPGNFPLGHLNEFEVRPGQRNMVALTAVKVNADPGILDSSPNKRNCFFQNETAHVRIHRNYSQANCLFECFLRNAQDLVMKAQNGTSKCTPWSFPFLDKGHEMCNQKSYADTLEAMQSEVPEDGCRHCLPDCERVIYQPMMTTQKFKVCDKKNFGMSPICNFKSINIKPQIWGKQALNILNVSGSNMTNYQHVLMSSQRIIKSSLFDSNETQIYDAFERDIAILNVFFSSPTAVGFVTKPSKTYFDVISAIGGNAGLFIGFSLVTILELGWLLLRIVYLYLKS